ncbi:DUF5753 domain-containing protein [Actinoalloteichus sp. GBA129-24]|uniref:DUF5753 domain-containing protein n=1 Tax=Actinoalloteichus sp. GBA129-24 TaxID=1612551 RepID=UPI00214FB174|nr:DUF5753 domain-containing protein [Actinoalloteichus sp. GBA129-24]
MAGQCASLGEEGCGSVHRELGRRLDRSAPWVLTLERGELLITPDVVSAAAVAIGLPHAERERLVERARDLGASPFTPGTDLPDQLSTLIGYEREATAITELSRVVPGLLQTRDYARAMVESSGPGRYDVEELVEARLARQGVLGSSTSDVPAYTAFMDESALQRPVGSPDVMAAQLRRLSETRPRVTIRVIPVSAGPYVSMVSSFSHFSFPDADPVVYLEHFATGTYLDKPRDTDPYGPVLASLHDVALPSDKSAEVIAHHQQQHERQAG